MPRLRLKKGKVEWWLMVYVQQRNCINLIGREVERPFPENQVAENTACSVSDWWNIQGLYVTMPAFWIFKVNTMKDPWYKSVLYFVLAYSLLKTQVDFQKPYWKTRINFFQHLISNKQHILRPKNQSEYWELRNVQQTLNLSDFFLCLSFRAL